MISLRSCKRIEIRCLLTSPLHITQRTYANLLRCTPFVPGTTIRGALLGYLIQQHCSREKILSLRHHLVPEVQRFHLECETQCPVKVLFDPKQVVFSFGLFQGGNSESRDYRLITRIALTRDGRAVSKGRLVTVEQIAPQAELTTAIFLFEKAGGFTSLITQALSQIGEYVGIGRFKSVGLGRFEVKKNQVSSTELNEVVQERLFQIEKVLSSSNGKLKLSVATPLVLGEKSLLYSNQYQELGDNLARLFWERTSEVVQSPIDDFFSPVMIKVVSVEMKPEFISRYSLENSQREGRLVLWPGSNFVIETKAFDQEALLQIAIGSILGVGEWREFGFGCFAVEGCSGEQVG